MRDGQNTGAVRGAGEAEQDTGGRGAAGREDAGLGADGAPRDEWREEEDSDETQEQREQREVVAEEHRGRFAKGPVRGPI